MSGRMPDAGGKTSLIRASNTSPGVPKSSRSAPPNVTRTKFGDTRSTARTSARARTYGGRVRVVDSADMMPSDRGDHRLSGDRIRGDVVRHAEDLFDERVSEHLARRTCGVHLAVPHRDEFVAVAGGEVEVVQHH